MKNAKNEIVKYLKIFFLSIGVTVSCYVNAIAKGLFAVNKYLLNMGFYENDCSSYVLSDYTITPHGFIISQH